MLRADATDAELEFDNFKEGFEHLRPRLQHPDLQDLSIIAQGLSDAINNLAFLNALYPLMNRQLIDRDLLPSLENIEAPVQSILAAMECRGVAFYPNHLKRNEAQANERIEALEAQARTITNDSSFLLSSPQQISNYLYDILKMKVPSGLVQKTKSQRSTSEETLQALKAASNGSPHPIIDVILEFRTLNKLLTTYIKPLPTFCRRINKMSSGKRSKQVPQRIHPQWSECVLYSSP